MALCRACLKLLYDQIILLGEEERIYLYMFCVYVCVMVCVFLCAICVFYVLKAIAALFTVVFLNNENKINII